MTDQGGKEGWSNWKEGRMKKCPRKEHAIRAIPQMLKKKRAGEEQKRSHFSQLLKKKMLKKEDTDQGGGGGKKVCKITAPRDL